MRRVKTVPEPAAVSALLERRRRGEPVSVDQLLDDEDFDLLREESAANRLLEDAIADTVRSTPRF